MPLTDAPTTDAPNPLLDEMDAMSDALVADDDAYALVTDEPEDPDQGDVSTDPPVEEDEDDEVQTDAPTTDAPEDPLEAKIAELEAKLQELEAGPSPTDAPTTDAPIQDQDFLDGVDVDDLYDDPGKLNTLLNKVYKSGVEASRGQTGITSEQVDQVVNTRMQMYQDSQRFYADNEDLRDHAQTVSEVFKELQEAEPDAAYSETLAKVAPEVRKRLKLKPKADRPPPLPKKRSSRRAAPASRDKDPLLKEMDDMDSALESF